ncbi:UNKNOWN [Stylonychia lemnae]|uniref:Cysteine protease n=1 Tax=Stylonychia lemnae TaxID=5949 RepID=A0A078A5B9_STYLE|nr:UNKNOWN [Stylonychia lemnae]|eukprot:CDW77084.1 UNKNOWN [Stylonychia lemnae]
MIELDKSQLVEPESNQHFKFISIPSDLTLSITERRKSSQNYLDDDEEDVKKQCEVINQQNEKLSKIQDSFECIEYTTEPGIINNVMLSISNTTKFSFLNKIDSFNQSVVEKLPPNCNNQNLYQMTNSSLITGQLTFQSRGLRENLMQKLTNLRYRFNDGDLIEYMAYPKVSFGDSSAFDKTAFLFNSKYNSKKSFNSSFKSIIWVSYRNNFPQLTRNISIGSKNYLQPSLNDKNQIEQKFLTSDCGWGCMIRCQQMMLANALVRLDSSYHKQFSMNNDEILELFLDIPEKYFSIHQITEEGKISMDKQPGDWYGVNSITQVIKNIFDQKSTLRPDCPQVFKKISFMVFQEGAIFMNEIKQELLLYLDEYNRAKTEELNYNKKQKFQQHSKTDQHKKFMEKRKLSSQFEMIDDNLDDVIVQEEDSFQLVGIESTSQSNTLSLNEQFSNKSDEKSLYTHDSDYPKAALVVITMRLGLNKIEEEYFDTILECFSLPQCVGILGGKPSFALYFVGHQDKQLIFLDPHYVQDSLKTKQDLQNDDLRQTYYPSGQAKKIKMDGLDPCIGVGFLIRNSEDLRTFEEAFSKTGKLSKIATLYQDRPKDQCLSRKLDEINFSSDYIDHSLL